jgi:ubiquinone/menaquinone biosynthesis C-methylase UbiE
VYSWKEYWSRVARSHAWTDDEGFSAVLHPDAPRWFNITIDQLQEKAWRKGLEHCQLNEHSRVLDVGCGTGRWLRRYRQEKVHPVGLDATYEMLRRAADGGLICPLVVSRAQELPFRGETFQIVSAVTVIQHLPSADQRNAIREMARVLQPGGHLMLLDLIRGSGRHIFPRRPKAWIAEVESAGLSLDSWTGQEYFLFDRAFVSVVQTARKLTGHVPNNKIPMEDDLSGEAAQQSSLERALYWRLRKVTCRLSAKFEPLAQRLCPREWATHGLFVFQKKHRI